jgi:cytochrome bd-type quinol oxidase subunit 2
MRWLSRLLGAVLALALTTGAAAWVLTSTVANEQYLVRQTEQAGTAEQVAAGLLTALAPLTPAPDDTKVILEDAVTPGYIRDHIETLLPQLVRYYTQDGPMPELDLSGLAQRIETAGFAVPPGLAGTLETPHSVTAGRLDGLLASAAQQSRQLVWLAPLVAVVVALLIVALARQRRWKVLAGSTLGAALATAVLAGLAYLPPTLISSTLATSSIKSLAPAVRTLTDAVAKDQSQRLLWIAAAFGVAALVLSGVNIVVKLRHRRKKEA